MLPVMLPQWAPLGVGTVVEAAGREVRPDADRGRRLDPVRDAVAARRGPARRSRHPGRGVALGGAFAERLLQRELRRRGRARAAARIRYAFACERLPADSRVRGALELLVAKGGWGKRARGRLPGHRGARELRHRGGRAGRGRRWTNGAPVGAPRGLRGGLRRRDQPRRRAHAARERGGLRALAPRCTARSPSATARWCRATSTTTRWCASTRAPKSRCISWPSGTRAQRHRRARRAAAGAGAGQRDLRGDGQAAARIAAAGFLRWAAHVGMNADPRGADWPCSVCATTCVRRPAAPSPSRRFTARRSNSARGPTGSASRWSRCPSTTARPTVTCRRRW